MSAILSAKWFGLMGVTLAAGGLTASAATVLIDQNFDDTSMFPLNSTISQGGVGDAGTSAGLWTASADDYQPQIVADPANASNHVVAVKRHAYGLTSLFGHSDDAITSGVFSYQYSIYLPDANEASMAVNINNQTAVENGSPLPIGQQFRAYSDNDVIVSSTPDEALVSGHEVWGYGLGANGAIPVATWNTIRAVVDMDQGTWSMYLTSGANPEVTVFTDRALRTGDLSNVSAIGFYPQYPNTDHVVYLDNISLARVPEPASLGLLGLGGLAMLIRRKRK